MYASLQFILLAIAICFAAPTQSYETCKYVPGDVGWPNWHDWAELNKTVGGRLVATVPQANICHYKPYSNFDEAACRYLQTRWDLPQTFELKPAEIGNAYFQNQSCDPFTPASRPCLLGNYAAYSINVSNVDDVRAGIRFAEEKNIRLVIKSTGHDYMGKSTGHGALSLWMFNLKTLQIDHDYRSPNYSGPVIKVGSGVVAGEAYEAAFDAGFRVVGGECASVGLGAGYTQGGGHSILSSAYGLAVDNVLEWEVVTALGQHVVATPEQHADLYWALSGGGGGTFGVVLSMKAKIFPEGPVGGGSLNFNLTGAGNNQTLFWEAIELWNFQLPRLVGDRNTILYNLLNDSFGAFSFTLPDQDDVVLKELLAPFLMNLEEREIPYELTTQTSPTYFDHFTKYLGPLPYGSMPLTMMTSRLLPRPIVQKPRANSEFTSALRSIVASGNYLVGCNALNVANKNAQTANSALPAWRDSIALCAINAFWDYTAPLSQNLAVKQEMVSVHDPVLEAATPGSGVYLNEVDPLYEGDWKQTMYGTNYDRLLQIKERYDPRHIFYAHFAVGSDQYTIDSGGRLCRKKTSLCA